MENAHYPITPERFWAVLASELARDFEKNPKQMVDKFCDDQKWTDYMIDLLDRMGQEKFACTVMSRNTEKEFWPKVDVAYFDKGGDNWGPWAWEAAIEHENNDWHEECHKLLLLNAGLKVVVGYWSDEDELKKDLLDFTEFYRSRKYHQEKENWLMIFGPTTNLWRNHNYRAYRFDGNELHEITGKKVVISAAAKRCLEDLVS